MENAIGLSLVPLDEARWEPHPELNIRLKIAALSSVDDQKYTREATDEQGRFDLLAFYGLVVENNVKEWVGVGSKLTLVPCNTENKALFTRNHGMHLGAWVVNRARSFDHYRVTEVEEAKKD